MQEIEKNMNFHNLNLNKFASKDENAIYLKEHPKDFRTPYFRDIDKIIYSLSFIRYQDKTQVFSHVSHDHISKRMIHVLFVSKIARTIGRALGLNEDLIEAASLAHDLGHVPFGHIGESILNEISIKHNEGYFNHNVESVRVLMNIENFGKGLDISVQVLDAILCHNGEIALGVYTPREKSKDEFLMEYKKTYEEKSLLTRLCPMTLEGCVVRVSDLIAYLGRDIEDAIRVKLVETKDLPKEITDVLGSTTRDIVNTCIEDIIKNSIGKNYIKLSPEVFNAMEKLKKFNYENIYNKSESTKEKEDLKIKFNLLFDSYLTSIKNNDETSLVVNSYLRKMDQSYKETNTPERIVIDYIAGMTDDFFLREYDRIQTRGNNENT